MKERLPPCDAEAEMALIGAILIRPEILRDLAPLMDASDFYDPKLQHVFAACIELHMTGRPVDLITVKAESPDLIDYKLLQEAQNLTPSTTAWKRYADIVVENSRKRRIIKHSAELIERAYDMNSDVDAILAEHSVSADRLLAPRSADIAGLFTLVDFMAAEQLIADHRPWLVPHILKPLWRIILVAGEGGSKSVTMRMIAVNAAAGRDPWAVGEYIDPVRVLYADFENPAETVAEQIRLANQMTSVDIIAECEDYFHIWHREGGINLRDRKPLAEFESVLQRTRPQIVFAGPLYKMYRRSKSEDLEQAAMEVAAILDDLRVRYNFALMIEHHAPKGLGANRDLNPFGSSVWQRWPEVGLTLSPASVLIAGEAPKDLTVGRFRPDRVTCQWPVRLERDKPFQNAAWVPTFGERRWEIEH